VIRTRGATLQLRREIAACPAGRDINIYDWALGSPDTTSSAVTPAYRRFRCI